MVTTKKTAIDYPQNTVRQELKCFTTENKLNNKKTAVKEISNKNYKAYRQQVTK